MFSSFLSDFESFINTTELEELENLAGHLLIKGIENDQNCKLQFLNQGVNSKELVLFFLSLHMDNFQKHASDQKNDVSIEFIELFKRVSHLRIRWVINSADKTLRINAEMRNKRQLSVKSRGTYYTPNWMSEFICKESIQKISSQKLQSLDEYIQTVITSQSKIEVSRICEIIPIRLIDLSMGIGNFLCDSLSHIINYLENVKEIIRKNLIPVLPSEDTRLLNKVLPFLSEQNNRHNFGTYIAQNCIYGIEIDPWIYHMSKIVIKLKFIYLLGIEPLEFPNLVCRNTIISLKNPPKTDEIENLIKNLNGIVFNQQFPEVFIKNGGGFDIILGNPPWEILKPNMREFFSTYNNEFITLSRTEQDEIQSILLKNPSISAEFEKYVQNFELQINTISRLEYLYQSSIIRNRMYTGDPQLFKYFLEIAYKIVKEEGIISLLVQHNFMGSKNCAELRKTYLKNGRFNGIWEFYNRLDGSLLFQNVDPNLRFIIFQFFKREGLNTVIPYKRCYSKKEFTKEFPRYTINSPDFYFHISNEEFQMFGFENEKHKSVFEKLTSTRNDLSQFLWIDGELSVDFSQDLHLTRDRHKFSRKKTPHTISGGRNFGPYYFVENKVRYLSENHAQEYTLPNSSIICRNILPNSAKRIIFSIPPPKMFIDNSCTRISLENNNEDIIWFILALGNSLLVEFYLRTILTGMNLNYYLIQRIPIPSHKTLIRSKNRELIREITELSKKLTQIPIETTQWAKSYARTEYLIAHLFELSKNEIEVVLNSLNLSKLQKTKFSMRRPFLHLTKEMVLSYF